MKTPPPRWAMAFLAVWFCLLALGMASLMMNHVFAMPAPTDDERLEAALAKVRRHSDRPLALHIIYENCSCTNLLVEELLERGPTNHWEEVILFVGASPERHRRAQRNGFETHQSSALQLKTQWGVEAAPVLLLLDQSGALAYAGGYFETPATVSPQEVRLMRQLLEGTELSPLPIYGCAVSAQLQAQTDPLGIKY